MLVLRVRRARGRDTTARRDEAVSDQRKFGGVDMGAPCRMKCDRPGCTDPCARLVLHDGWCSCIDHASTKDIAREARESAPRDKAGERTKREGE